MKAGEPPQRIYLPASAVKFCVAAGQCLWQCIFSFWQLFHRGCGVPQPLLYSAVGTHPYLQYLQYLQYPRTSGEVCGIEVCMLRHTSTLVCGRYGSIVPPLSQYCSTRRPDAGIRVPGALWARVQQYGYLALPQCESLSGMAVWR